MDLNKEQKFHNEVYKYSIERKSRFSQMVRSPFYKLLTVSIDAYEKEIINQADKHRTILEIGGGVDPLIKRIPYSAENQLSVRK